MHSSPIDCSAVTDLDTTLCEGEFIAAIVRPRVADMKRLFVTGMVLSCLSFGSAQVLQGKVRLSGIAIAVTGNNVTLAWTGVQNATSYNLYRGIVSGGPYVLVVSGVAVTTYTDAPAGHNETLYYVATAVKGNNESGYSNETAAVIT